MTIPFWCVVFLMVVPVVLSMAGAAFRVRELGELDNKHPRLQAQRLEGAGHRIYAAQQNAWEALALFGLAVVIAHLAGADPGASATAALAFVGLRILHTAAYAANLDIVRSSAYLLSLVCVGRLIALAALA